MQEMLFIEKDINWNDFDGKLKRGRVIMKSDYQKNGAIRTKWGSTAAPFKFDLATLKLILG